MWRQKNGFFTALDRQGELLTWSLLNGKLLYAEDQKETDGSKTKNKGYEVYRGDEDDNTYCRDYFNRNDDTIQLLYTAKSICDN